MKNVPTIIRKVLKNPLTSFKTLIYLLRYLNVYGIKVTYKLLSELIKYGDIPLFISRIKRSLQTKTVKDNYSLDELFIFKNHLNIQE